MRTYQISYDPNENEGVYALSVVKSPAMQSKFLALTEAQKFKLATVSEERRILMGVALIPNKLIYRNDPKDGEYNIVFSKETIQQAAYDFIRKGNSNNSTIEHKLDLGSDSVSVVESWIIEDDVQDKSRKFGFSEPVGSWMVTMKIHDDAVWQMAKAGEIEGFSIDGFFNLNEITMSENKPASKWEQFMKLFADTSDDTSVKLGEVKSADGSVTMEYEGDTLEAGAGISIASEDGNVPVPVGEYQLEDDKILVVSDEGIIGEVKDAEAEVPAEADQVEMNDDEFAKLIDAIMGLKETTQTLTTQLSDVKTELAEIKAKPASEGIKPKATKLTIETKGKLTLAERLENLKNKQ